MEGDASTTTKDPGTPAAQSEIISSAALSIAASSITNDTGIPSIAEELAFLTSPDCNPDLNDPEVKSRGFMRGGDKKKTTLEDLRKRHGTFGTFRHLVGAFTMSFPVQTVVMLVILFDCILTIVGFAVDEEDLPEDHTVYLLGDWLVVIVLSFDVLARFFHQGPSFLQAKMNVFELVLVPITIAEIFLIRELGTSLPLPLLRALRPIFRAIRVIRVIVRTAGKGKSYILDIRHKISGDRVRFTQDGFDLDLAYVTHQIVATSILAVGRESILRNPSWEVARFFNERHGNKYLVVNTMEEKKYNTAPFFERYLHFPIAKDGVPTLNSLMNLCRQLDSFLKADPDHVVAVHSRHAQGRAGIVIIGLLLYRGMFSTVTAAISHYENNRVHPDSRATASTQTLDNASQRRFLDYFAAKCFMQKDDKTLEVRTAQLKRITLIGFAGVPDVHVWVHGHPHNTRKGTHKGPKDDRSSTAANRGSREESDVGDYDLEEGPLDGDPDEDQKAIEEAMDMHEATLAAAVKRTLEEGQFDSQRAGGTALQNPAVLCSDPGFKVGGITINVPSAKAVDEDPLVPTVWDISDATFDTEFRIEVHRALSEDEKTPHKKPGIGQKIMMSLMGQPKEEDDLFEGGMMFGAWLHAGFLELSESSDDYDKSKPQLVTITWDRFGIDKAANAPSLRSYSTSMKIQLQFEVEKRFNFNQIMDEAINAQAPSIKSTAGLATSEMVSLGWLTWVAQRIWPNFTSEFERMLKESLVPLLQSLPGPLKHVKLSQCSFGDNYPRFGPINACSKDKHGLEVQLDIVLQYSTDTNIVLDMGFASLAIAHLQINGLLSLKFKPILEELPVFSAMSLLFLNQPEIDLRFARGLEIANKASVRNVIFGGVNKAVYDLLVLPNLININWADPDSLYETAVSFQSILPEAIVRFRVKGARGIKTVGKKVPDIYVRASLGLQTANTAGIAPRGDKRTSPGSKEGKEFLWDEEFDFLVYDERQFIKIDVLQKKQSIGKTHMLTVSEVVSAGPDGLWVKLEDTPGQARSEINLEASLLNLVVDPEAIEEKISGAQKEPASSTSASPEKSIAPSSNEATHTSSMMVEAPTIAAGNSPRKSPRETPEKDEEKALASEDDEENAHADLNLNIVQVHSGAVALLVCNVFGGSVPPEVADVKMVDLKIALGHTNMLQRLSEASANYGVISEKLTKSVWKLASLGVDSEKIGAALDLDPIDVQRVVRKKGWNLELTQKICLLLHPADLSCENIEVTMHAKKKTVAKGSVSLTKVITATNSKGEKNLRYSMVMSLVGERTCSLDLEFRLFTLNLEGSTVAPRKSEKQHTSPERGPPRERTDQSALQETPEGKYRV